MGRMKTLRQTKAALWTTYRHWLYVLILPVYFVGFFAVESLIDSQFPYMVTYLPLDDRIPFCEWFVLAYVLWYPFMVSIGLCLGITNPQGFRKYMTYIGISFMLSLVIFLLFPNGQNLRVDLDALGRENLCTRLIGALYTADTNTNVCPSLHVVGSMAVVFGVLHDARLRKSVWAPVASIVIASCIIASTVLIKQHSIVDVLVGVPYGLLIYGLVYWVPVWWRHAKGRSIAKNR